MSKDFNGKNSGADIHLHPSGKFVYASNSKWSGYKYVGGYKNNLRNGFGIMSYPSGDNYKGGWKNDKKHGSGVYIFADGKIKNGFWQNGKIQYYKNKPIKNHKIIKSPLQVKKEKQKILELKNKIALLEKKEKKLEEEERKRKLLERKIAILEAEKYQSEKKIRSIEVGSGFFVSKFRHIVTNHHVIGKCKKITVGSNFKNQIPAEIIASDKRNDLAILQISSMQNASNETKAFVKKLAIKIVPVIAGAGGGTGKILAGAALIGLAFATGGASLAFNSLALANPAVVGISTTALGSIALNVGIGLALAGVSELLFPVPKPEKFENDQDPRISFDFGGTPNTSRAGTTHPIVYGEIFTGSTVISMNLTTDQVTA